MAGGLPAEELRRILMQSAIGIAVEPMGEDDALLPPERISSDEEVIRMPLPQWKVTLTCPVTLPGGEGMMRLAAALAHEMATRKELHRGPQEHWRAQLLGEEIVENLPTGPRCILALSVLDETPLTQLEEMIPLQPMDVLVPIAQRTFALIKDTSGIQAAGELLEYAKALQDTLLVEEGCTLLIGVSDAFNSAGGMPEAWRQASEALRIGQVFHPEWRLFIWNRLLVERILTELPRERMEAYRSQVFNRRTARLFNEEMLETIRTFLDKDLNLSDTARQLYIHRNTLVYRLDKVLHATGLDLRSFNDAMTFRLLLYLRNQEADEHPRENTNRRTAK